MVREKEREREMQTKIKIEREMQTKIKIERERIAEFNSTRK